MTGPEQLGVTIGCGLIGTFALEEPDENYRRVRMLTILLSFVVILFVVLGLSALTILRRRPLRSGCRGLAEGHGGAGCPVCSDSPKAIEEGFGGA